MADNIGTGERSVLVDMDGVLADFEEANNNILKSNFPDITVKIDRSEFYFTDTYLDYPLVNEIIEREVRVPGFFTKFPVVDGAIHGWRRIMEAGYIPTVCSSPLKNHETVIAEKIDWLEEHFVPEFGAWVVDTAIFNRDKSGYDAIAMIDDRPTVRGAENASWQHIMFSRSYNKKVRTDYRLEDWYDPGLEDLLVRTHNRYLTKC